MPTPRTVRCQDWITSDEATAAACWPDSVVDPADITELVDAASDWLFEVTSGQFTGICETVWRPVDPWCGSWHGDGCGCARASTVDLPWGPIVTVEAVVEAGVTISEGVDFRIIAPNRLVRIGRSWPACNDPRQLPAATSRGAWYVRYTWGNEIPALGKQAALALACEFARGSTGGKCALPAGTVSVSGLGLTVNLDSEQAASSVPAVAAFLGAYPRSHVGAVKTGRRRGFVDVLA